MSTHQIRRVLGNVIIAAGLAGGAVLAVWSPVGSWWRWLVTGAAVMIVGGIILPTEKKDPPAHEVTHEFNWRKPDE